MTILKNAGAGCEIDAKIGRAAEELGAQPTQSHCLEVEVGVSQCHRRRHKISSRASFDKRKARNGLETEKNSCLNTIVRVGGFFLLVPFRHKPFVDS